MNVSENRTGTMHLALIFWFYSNKLPFLQGCVDWFCVNLVLSFSSHLAYQQHISAEGLTLMLDISCYCNSTHCMLLYISCDETLRVSTLLL